MNALAFRIPVAVIAAAAFDHAFVSREPGTPADVGRAYASVSLTAADGVRLAAWYVPSRNGAAVIAFPGRSGPVAHARLLARHGYGVLLLDRRGEGASEGDINLYGWNGEADVRAAVEYLRRRPDVDPDRIGGLGLSVLVGRIAPRPVLLIRAVHGNPDEALNRVYAAKTGGSLWEADRGGHTGALDAMPAEYERRVVGFFDATLLHRP